LKIDLAILAKSLLALALTTLVAFAFVPPIPQALSYHNFADQNAFCSIPHFWNVVSNLPFLFVSILGATYIRKRPDLPNRNSWVVFVVGVGLVALGSSYYHWNPNNQTLVWDRMPMTIGFIAALTAICSEVFGKSVERLLWIFLAIGVASVCVWWAYDDLRFYAWVQFFPFLALFVMLVFDQGRIRVKHRVVYAILYYVVAKVFEHWDAAVYSLSGDSMSGHAIKHVFAALGTWELIRRLPKL
jgi:hypothetical protein